MKEPQSFCTEDNCYYPVWIEPDGTEWASHEVWECCEHAEDPKRAKEYLNNLFENIEADAPSPYDCSKPVEYAGGGRALCGSHFEEIKANSTVRWVRLEDY